jgi:ribonuclease BN (tRNA processing enzyme)
MRLTVVGCSGSYPGPDSPASCYLVEQEADGRTWRIVLDLGSGALGYLHRYVDPLAVDAVFLSHLHPDHCFDMSGFYVLRKYHPDGVRGRVPVHGPGDTARRLATAYGLPERPGMTGEFDFTVYDGQPIDLGPFRVVTTKVDHPVAAYALKVSAGDGSLVYSGDTGPCQALTALAKGADLLLAEASFVEDGDNPPNLHMTGREAARTATAAGAGRLVLTHVPPWYDPRQVLEEARPSYDGPLELARTGATYEIV